MTRPVDREAKAYITRLMTIRFAPWHPARSLWAWGWRRLRERHQ